MLILQRINYIKQEIATAIQENHRPLDSVTLMAVTKGRSLSDMTQVIEAGLIHFGENYWQEAQKKIAYFQNQPLIWHFIGKIQKNKAPAIANAVQWVESLDNLAVANALSRNRRATLPPLNVCIQINLQQEATKSGIDKSSLLPFAKELIKMPHLCLRGLMIIPQASKDENVQYNLFSQLAELKDQLSSAINQPLDTLSMGMSDDFRAAIRAGSTVIRVGRSIFEERAL